MGGSGSGHWYRWNAKTTVEDCFGLDVTPLARDQTFQPGRSGTITWSSGRPARIIGSVGYSVDQQADGLYFTLSYKVASGDGMLLPIRLQQTRPYFGGSRWWFTCPLVVGNNPPCRRRVGKLYLRGKYFGCRQCHDLTYKSCQESHQLQRFAALLGFSPEILRAIGNRTF